MYRSLSVALYGSELQHAQLRLDNACQRLIIKQQFSGQATYRRTIPHPFVIKRELGKQTRKWAGEVTISLLLIIYSVTLRSTRQQLTNHLSLIALHLDLPATNHSTVLCASRSLNQATTELSPSSISAWPWTPVQLITACPTRKWTKPRTSINKLSNWSL
jgi:hypothetical protein